jgi:hypothetical protein
VYRASQCVSECSDQLVDRVPDCASIASSFVFPEADIEGVVADAVPTASRGGESAAAAYGREVHAGYDYGSGFRKEFTGDNGQRSDAVSVGSREVVELKPNNKAAIARGLRKDREVRYPARSTVPRRSPVHLPSRDLQPAMSERNAIQRAFDSFGRDAGFEKKAGSWYHRGVDVIAISNPQKSQYRPHY